MCARSSAPASSYSERRRTTVLRRSEYELAGAEDRAHILEGRLQALQNVDEVVDLIRGSEDRSAAIEALQTDADALGFTLSEAQAEHIVRMQLGSLTSMEAEDVKTEYAEVQTEIERLETILGSRSELDRVVTEELEEMKDKYDDERRTTFMEDVGSVTREDLIPEEDVVVVVTEGDYLKRMPLAAFDPQHRGGKGIIGVRPKDGDRVATVFEANTHDYLLCFTSKGQVYRLKTYEIPEMGRTARGTSAQQVLDLDGDEEINAVVDVADLDEENYLAMATRDGYVKRTAVGEFENVHSGGIRAITLEEGDSLADVEVTDGGMDLVIASRQGMTIRFDESEARSMGRTARGVNGIELQGDDEVAGLVATHDADERALLTVTRMGFGKRTPLSAYRRQSRYGKGLIDIKTTERNGPVVAVNAVTEDDGLVIMSESGQIMRTHVDEVSTQGRNTMGVVAMGLDDEDWVASVDTIPAVDNAPDAETDTPPDAE